MRRLLSLALTVALITITLDIGCAKKPDEIKIGAILPLTGDAALYGQNLKKGMDHAINEINEKGGIKGKRIAIIYEDSKALPAEGVSSFKKLINIHKVSVVIGDAVSSVTLAISPIANKNKVLVLSPLSSAPAITNAGDFIFRNVPSDLYGGKVAAYFAVRDQGWVDLAILYVNNDFGEGLKQVFSKEVRSIGGRVIAIEGYEQGSTDFRTQLIKIKVANPDAVFLIGYREVPQILIQAKEIGFKTQFIGTGLLEDPNVIKVAKDAAEGVYFTQLQYDPESTDSVVQQFVNHFEKNFGAKPDIIAAYGFDAVNVLCFAMGKSNFTSESIKEQLYKVSRYKGVTGEISFDENGDVIQPMGVKIIKSGELMFAWYERIVSVTD